MNPPLLNNKEVLSIFFEAIEQEDTETLLALDDMIWDIDTSYEGDQILLYYAAFLGKVESIKILVSQIRVDINVKDKNDWTALHYAALNEDIISRTDVIHALVQLGADAYALDKSDYRASRYVIGNDQNRYYSQEQKQKSIDLALRINTSEVAKLLQMDDELLALWIYNYKKNDILSTVKSSYSQKDKERAIKLALEGDLEEVARDLKIPYSTLSGWVRRSKNNSTLSTQERSSYSQEEKERSLQFALKNGLTKTVKDLNIPYGTLVQWFPQYNFINKLPVQKSYSQKEKDEAIQLALEKSIIKASELLDIKYHNVSFWVREHKKRHKIPMRHSYSPEEKNKAIQLALEIGVARAARNLNIPYKTLNKWFKRKTPTAQSSPPKKEKEEWSNVFHTSKDLEQKAVLSVVKGDLTIDEAIEDYIIDKEKLNFLIRMHELNKLK